MASMAIIVPEPLGVSSTMLRSPAVCSREAARQWDTENGRPHARPQLHLGDTGSSSERVAGGSLQAVLPGIRAGHRRQVHRAKDTLRRMAADGLILVRREHPRARPGQGRRGRWKAVLTDREAEAD